MFVAVNRNVNVGRPSELHDDELDLGVGIGFDFGFFHFEPVDVPSLNFDVKAYRSSCSHYLAHSVGGVLILR